MGPSWLGWLVDAALGPEEPTKTTNGLHPSQAFGPRQCHEPAPTNQGVQARIDLNSMATSSFDYSFEKIFPMRQMKMEEAARGSVFLCRKGNH
mmetsp:Transcript_13106/g.19323  ORF Transcript_13106/g.19323 Transcript_13106/m.19323 type:complete len:93 (+) Transcript_13106:570-848(+)